MYKKRPKLPNEFNVSSKGLASFPHGPVPVLTRTFSTLSRGEWLGGGGRRERIGSQSRGEGQPRTLGPVDELPACAHLLAALWYVAGLTAVQLSLVRAWQHDDIAVRADSLEEAAHYQGVLLVPGAIA